MIYDCLSLQQMRNTKKILDFQRIQFNYFRVIIIKLYFKQLQFLFFMLIPFLKLLKSVIKLQILHHRYFKQLNFFIFILQSISLFFFASLSVQLWPFLQLTIQLHITNLNLILQLIRYYPSKLFLSFQFIFILLLNLRHDFIQFLQDRLDFRHLHHHSQSMLNFFKKLIHEAILVINHH